MNSETLQIETVVIGAGVVGLAVARALAMQGQDVVLLEQEARIGHHTSSRNSEVIHAGLYYPQNSLKATHCVAGKHRLYEFCQSHQVAFKQCGKLIVANNSQQQEQLQQIAVKARNNGVDDLKLLHGTELQELEPHLNATAALLSPSTGIIDSHGYMLALQGDLEQHSGHLVLNSRVIGGRVAPTATDHHRLLINTADGDIELLSRNVINCGGLFATAMLQTLEQFPNEHIPTVYFAQGNYFALQGRAPFSHLIYPVPEAGGLGVHLTLDLAGQARFGPDVQWLPQTNPDELEYRVNTDRESHFYQAIRCYWPDLQDGKLTADYCGIRPKLTSKHSQSPADFRIDCQAQHGIPGWINLFGIESPGLTASLSLAEAVCNILARN
ncbi:MAG: NAD(P)/FAD-dependent oxidoreductase [Candidatus Pelagadaptatus aseana]|uniref:NAD(P)/FAD-dependent oxidoreductase n=1 Tax=Candidatus Pelagadaptatus aseana TaxID=3120508 RepID=UPI0039B2B143